MPRIAIAPALTLAAPLLFALATPGFAQDVNEQKEDAARTGTEGKQVTPEELRERCKTFAGSARSKCLDDVKKAEAAAKNGTSGDAKLVNETNTAAQAKSQAGDHAGAIALYDAALAQAGKKTPIQYLLVGKAIAQRRQAVAAYNEGQMQNPGPGATNEAIRFANAANSALAARKIATSVPLVRAALATAAAAATAADERKDKGAEATVGIELRESAGLLYRIDRAGTLSTPRSSAALEAAWLRRWLATPGLTEAQIAKSGFGTVAGVAASDPAAGLALADEVKARIGNDPEGTISYAEIVAAKAPAGDARRASAATALTTVEPSVTDPQQKTRLAQARAALAAR